MISAPPDVTVSIVSFNTKDLLRECLRSIIESGAELRIEIIVVDNASCDSSADMVAAEFPQVTLIRNGENRFFTRAHNQALRAAQGRYVLILNSDTRLKPGNLQTMVAFMDNHPNVGVASCLIRNPDGSVYRSAWRIRTLKTLFLNHFVGQKLRPHGLDEHLLADWDRLTTRQVDVIMDAYAFARREALQQIGWYDERYLLYYTEDDLCLAMHRAGWQVFHVAEAEVVHHYKASTKKQPSLFVRRIMIHDAVSYYRKHHGRLTGAVASLFLNLELLPRTLFIKLGGARRVDRA